jgi:hypothetical protein
MLNKKTKILSLLLVASLLTFGSVGLYNNSNDTQTSTSYCDSIVIQKGYVGPSSICYETPTDTEIKQPLVRLNK